LKKDFCSAVEKKKISTAGQWARFVRAMPEG
jgi:hypothetical protein